MTSRSPLYKSNLVALSYALLGGMYVAMLGFLMSEIWAGSLTTLWRDVRAASDSFTMLGTLAGIHFLMAALAYRFVRRTARSRALALLGASALFVITSYDAVKSSMAWFRGRLPVDLPFGGLGLDLIPPLMYGLLAYQLFRLVRTANTSAEGGTP